MVAVITKPIKINVFANENKILWVLVGLSSVNGV